MHSAGAAHFLHHVAGRGVERSGGAQRLGQRELLFGNIDRSHFRSRSAANLDGNVAESADAENRQSLPGANLGLLEGAMNRDSRTKQRRRLLGGKCVGNLDHVAGGSLRKFRISAIHHDAGDALLHAQILVAFTAKLTLTACPLHPRHSDPVSHLDTFLGTMDGRAPLHHPAYDLVSQD